MTDESYELLSTVCMRVFGRYAVCPNCKRIYQDDVAGAGTIYCPRCLGDKAETAQYSALVRGCTEEVAKHIKSGELSP